MSSFKSFVCLWIFLATTFHFGHGIKNKSALISEIQKRSDRRVSPKDISGVPVAVNVSIFITNLHAVDETKMEIGMDFYVRKSWTDSRLAFSDGPDKLSIDYDTAVDFIWMPDLFFQKSTFTQITQSHNKDAFVQIQPTGDILFRMRVTIKQRCQMDLRSFPLDKQSCPFKIATYFSSQDDVLLYWGDSSNPKGIGVTKRKHPPGFVLTDFDAAHDSLVYDKKWPILKATFYLDRIRTHYIVLTYIPAFLLVLISCFLFWLPLTAVTERFLFGALLLVGLTQILAHSQDQSPQVGYLKAIDVWVVSCYTFVCVALSQVIILYIVTKRMTGVKDDQIELMKSEDSNSTEKVRSGHLGGIGRTLPLEKVDLAMKILYPAAFLLFNIIYWSVYA